VNIIEALDDADVFRPFFKRTSWATWRVVFKAALALPMTDAELATYRGFTGRQTAPTKPFREVCLVVGRRGGKSRAMSLLATFMAAFVDWTPHLAPGERATVMIICADRKQSRIVMRYIVGMFDQIPMLAGLVTDRTKETLTLSNGIIIEIATASFRVTRGYSIALCIADEVAYWKSEDSSAPDVEIFRALRPSLATLPGSMLILASSPYRKRGVLYETHRRHYGVEDAPTLVWQAPTTAMNPDIDMEFIAQSFRDDPISAACELNAEFRGDIADYISVDSVRACVVPGRVSLPRSSGHFAFCDLAGGGADSHALAIAHTGPDGIGVLDLVEEIRGPSSPEDAVARFAAICAEYKCRQVTGDRYAASWPVLRFAAQVPPIVYEQSQVAKGEIYANTLPLILSQRVELLDDDRLVTQLASLERRLAWGGRTSVDHPPGGHDDRANAVAGALLLASGRISGGELWARLAG